MDSCDAWKPRLKLSWFIRWIGSFDSALVEILWDFCKWSHVAHAHQSLGMFPQSERPEYILVLWHALFCSSVGLSKSYLSWSKIFELRMFIPYGLRPYPKYSTRKLCMMSLYTLIKGPWIICIDMYHDIFTYIYTCNGRYCFSCVCIRCSRNHFYRGFKSAPVVKQTNAAGPHWGSGIVHSPGCHGIVLLIGVIIFCYLFGVVNNIDVAQKLKLQKEWIAKLNLIQFTYNHLGPPRFEP